MGALGCGNLVKTRHRRAFFTIWPAHLPEAYQDLARDKSDETMMSLYFEERKKYLREWKKERNSTLRGCAIALELGEENEGIHIQGYIELTTARTWAHYGRRFIAKPQAFNKVRSGIGSYEYCTRTGQYAEKAGVLENWATGPKEDFRLYDGSREKTADLKHCVGLIVEGYHPYIILKENPYAYTVHRQRLWSLWRDLQEVERTGTISDPYKKEAERL